MDKSIDDGALALIEEAIEDLRAGNVADALLVLERTVRPKFADSTAADGAYRMFKPNGAKNHIHDFFAQALGVQVSAHCGEP